VTRRGFCVLASAALHASSQPVSVPVRLVMDSRANWKRQQDAWSRIWAEAVGDFAKCGVRLESTTHDGEIRRSASGKPIFVGLASRVVNLVFTQQLPTDWDRGRGLGGVTTVYEGYHLCAIALDHAHTHRIPFVAVNTCVHELLHAFMLDIFERRPPGWEGSAREFRIDTYATRMWLFGDGSAVRESTAAYLKRLPGDKPA
jgi:hypothetical protein